MSAMGVGYSETTRIAVLQAAARLQSAKRSTPPPVNVRSSKQQRVEQEEEEEEIAEAVETAKVAAGLKVRRGAILDDEDDD